MHAWTGVFVVSAFTPSLPKKVRPELVAQSGGSSTAARRSVKNTRIYEQRREEKVLPVLGTRYVIKAAKLPRAGRGLLEL